MNAPPNNPTTLGTGLPASVTLPVRWEEDRDGDGGKLFVGPFQVGYVAGNWTNPETYSWHMNMTHSEHFPTVEAARSTLWAHVSSQLGLTA